MTVLFSPLGLAYGTLYSAILLVRPQRVVVVTSGQAVPGLHEALDAARFYHSPFTVQTHVLDDPYAGFRQGRALARRLQADGDEFNVINLSGGTTVMQDCVRSIGELLALQGAAVREVAVVDDRESAEQARHPLFIGRLVEIPPLHAEDEE